MSQTTPDIRQLSYCCGKQLTWTHIPMEDEPDGYIGRCSCGMAWSELLEPARLLLATEQILLAQNAELLATIANERGEGEAPVEGWAVVRNPMGPPARHWWWERHLVMVYRAESGVWTRNEYVPERGTIATSTHDTACAAMRAASSQGADVPKGQP